MMKSILLIYPEMFLGGSTTSLLALMNNLDPNKYNIDLQLQRNAGALLKEIPDYINLLPEAQKYPGKYDKYIRKLRIVLRTLLGALLKKRKRQNKGSSRGGIVDMSVKSLSKTNKKHYDYAIGFLEGWSDLYLAYKVNADKTYAWLHSTFANITNEPESQLAWMEKVDKIVFVTDACTEDFKKTLPSMAHKAITIENITDSSIIRKRSIEKDPDDKEYISFCRTDAFKIVTVCRITISTKGLDRIVNCAKELKSRGINFLWYIVGSGPDESRLAETIKAEGLTERIVLTGARHNPFPFIKEADIMCMPSRYEGKPMVITESLILGTPPVVTRYLSADSQIKNNFDGIVVENTDTSITDAVLECINNKEKLEKIRKNIARSEYGNAEYISQIEEKIF